MNPSYTNISLPRYLGKSSFKMYKWLVLVVRVTQSSYVYINSMVHNVIRPYHLILRVILS